MGDGGDIEQARTQFIENAKLMFNTPESCLRYSQALIDHATEHFPSSNYALIFNANTGFYDIGPTSSTQYSSTLLKLDNMSVTSPSKSYLEINTSSPTRSQVSTFRSGKSEHRIEDHIAHLTYINSQNRNKYFVVIIPETLINPNDSEGSATFISQLNSQITRNVFKNAISTNYSTSEEILENIVRCFGSNPNRIYIEGFLAGKTYPSIINN